MFGKINFAAKLVKEILTVPECLHLDELACAKLFEWSLCIFLALSAMAHLHDLKKWQWQRPSIRSVEQLKFNIKMTFYEALKIPVTPLPNPKMKTTNGWPEVQQRTISKFNCRSDLKKPLYQKLHSDLTKKVSNLIISNLLSFLEK